MRNITAFGESKSVSAWFRDPRRNDTISYSGFRKRIDRGFMSVEDAITLPKTQMGGRRTPILISAIGETKSMHGWSKDSRNKCTFEGVKHRVKRGVVPTDLFEPPFGWQRSHKIKPGQQYGDYIVVLVPENVNSTSKITCKCSCAIGKIRSIPVSTILYNKCVCQCGKFYCFGEWKSLGGWLKDPRTKASKHLIHRRLYTLHWDAETALTTPPKFTYTRKKK